VTGPTFRSLKFNADLPVLDVTASAGPDIYLWVINRSEQDAVETEITVTGSEPKLQRATAWTLTAQSSLVANDFERPDRIAPQQTNLALSGERLTYRFPKHSVVVLRLSR